MMGLGMMELAIIAGVATLIFGPRQLPKLAKGLGDSIRELRQAGRAIEDGAKGRLEE